jgi:hypothetical protein
MKSRVTVRFFALFFSLVTLSVTGAFAQSKEAPLLGSAALARYVRYFNSIDTETIKNYVPNKDAFRWLSANIPYFECPDSVMEEIYYYRWWTYRKHLVKTPEGYLFTEFITPVSHAGKYNSISCALGHHIYEGRWLHDQTYLDQAIWYWLLHDPYAHHPVFYKYSSWLSDAVYHRFLVNMDTGFITPLVPLLDQSYQSWEKQKQLPSGMFWQYDVRDGMEESIGGSRHDKNVRPTINSYMFGNAVALADMAKIVHIDSLASEYTRKASALKALVEKNLWNPKDQFFEVLEAKTGQLCGTREEIGYIPWYFRLPDDSAVYGRAWDQLNDTSGFRAPWGITTAERRSPFFRTHGTGDCEWDGAVWPFATTQTLKGLANLLTYYHHHDMSRCDYFRLLSQYARSMKKNGRPFIGEYEDGKTGYWLKGYSPRSKYYNHSTYCDLIITGLVGLKERPDDTLEVNPLVPAGKWPWFCLDRVRYHGHDFTIFWDQTGKKYHRGKGLFIYQDGRPLIHTESLKHVYAKINP